MLTPRANIHHAKLPAPGTLGYIVGLATVNPQRKCIVVAYPLCDNCRPYSLGIHTCWVRFLDNGDLQRFSGIWFQTCRGEVDYARQSEPDIVTERQCEAVRVIKGAN